MTQVEIVVIGGGVQGASAAYHLARAGKEVLLIEKESVGSGASGQSGGIIRCHYSNAAMVRVAQRAAEMWPELEQELGYPVDYVRNGIVVAVGEEDADTMRRIVAMQRSIGVDTDLISPQEIAGWIPEFSAKGLALAAYEASGGYADPASTALAFTQKARDLGATVVTGVAVTGIEMDGSQVRAVVTTSGTVRTSLVINCAGAWAPRIGTMVGHRLPVRPGVIEMAAFNPRYPGWTKATPTWLDLTTMTYCRPDGAGLMLAGGGLQENAELETVAVDPDRSRSRPSMMFDAQIAENLQLRCPWAAGMRHVRSWTGPDGNSPDFHFIFGAVPGIEGYFQVVGGSGNSFKLSPAIGEAVAEYVMTGECTFLDPHAFSVTRFAENRLLRGGYQMHIIG